MRVSGCSSHCRIGSNSVGVAPASIQSHTCSSRSSCGTNLAAILCEEKGPTYPRSLDVWGASLAECGEYDGAIEKLLLAKKYLDEHPELPRDPGLDERLAGYRSGTPYRFDR